MKKKFALLLLLLSLVSSNSFAGMGCVKQYMDGLDACSGFRSWTDQQVCEIDATIEYVGCLRRALLF